jgi:hypothetical protein
MEERATYDRAQEAAGGKTYGELGKPPAIVARATGIAAPGEKQPSEPEKEQ